MDTQTTLDAAIAAGYDRLSPRDVMLCVLAGASGGASGGGVQHGSNTPIALGLSVTPPSLFINDVDSTLWCVSNGTWIKLV